MTTVPTMVILHFRSATSLYLTASYILFCHDILRLLHWLLLRGLNASVEINPSLSLVICFHLTTIMTHYSNNFSLLYLSLILNVPSRFYIKFLWNFLEMNPLPVEMQFSDLKQQHAYYQRIINFHFLLLLFPTMRLFTLLIL